MHDSKPKSILLMMNKPDVIINGKSIANLRGRRITRHVMTFKSSKAELSAAVSSCR